MQLGAIGTVPMVPMKWTAKELVGVFNPHDSSGNIWSPGIAFKLRKTSTGQLRH